MYKNEQIKREFFEHLRGASGFADTSVKAFAEAIGQWQLFSENEDFASFDKTKALAFREWLGRRGSKTELGTLTVVTQYNYIRRVKKFFTWLADQPGYKSKALKNDVEFLRLSNKDSLIARAGTTRTAPTLEEARELIESIQVDNEVDRRDRAMISFALTTGCRIFAIVSLKMKNFDREKRLIYQNPGDGVHTKNSKKILTTFFPIGWDAPEQYFIEWYDYLEQKGFGPDDPIFPATINDLGGHRKGEVGNSFWSATSGARAVFEKRCKGAGIPYFHPHSFRHLVVSIMSKTRLTEEEKRAISLNLGHANVGTTFGSYGYGGMNDERAVELVKKLKGIDHSSDGSIVLTKEERDVLERLLSKR